MSAPLEQRFYLAPMAEITTPALRRLIRDFSPHGILYTEMLSAAAIVRGGYHDSARAFMQSFDGPIVFQIAGDDPAIMADACSRLADRGCSDIDINMGCSAPDIVKKGYGSALAKKGDLAVKAVSMCRAATPGKLSVKMRTGFECHDLPWLAGMCSIFRDEGVDRITVHGRFAKLAFRRTADWSLVKNLASALDIPVTGNGDISSAAMALKRLHDTGCHSVMIGREAIRSPWIFRHLYELESCGSSEFSVDIRDTFLRGLDYIGSMLPVEFHVSRAHRFSFYFCGNLAFGHGLFARIRHSEKLNEMTGHVEDYFRENPSEIIKKISSIPAEGV